MLTVVSGVERGSMEGKAEIFNTYYEDDVIRQARGKSKQQWEKSLPVCPYQLSYAPTIPFLFPQAPGHCIAFFAS